MKKKKLALATAVATLAAGLSLLSSVLASAEVWQSNEMVVFDVSDDFVLVGVPDRWETSRRYPQCRFYDISTKDPLFAPIAEQVKYGDVIYYSDEIEWGVTDSPRINSMVSLSDGTMEIIGSVWDKPFENFGSVTVDNQTSIQITGADGTRYVFEEGANVKEVDDFWAWECSGRYTGMYYDEETDSEKYSEELANKYNKESGRPIWIRPNEDGDVNSDDTIDSADAAVILEEIALYGVGDTGRMNASENLVADVNSDGTINAQDAALILSYSAEVGSGMLEGVTLKAYAGR